MCDDADFAEEERYLAERAKLSRRGFTEMVGAGALLASVPSYALAKGKKREMDIIGE